MKELMRQINEAARALSDRAFLAGAGFFVTADFYDSMIQYRTLQHMHLEMEDLGSKTIDRDFTFPIPDEGF